MASSTSSAKPTLAFFGATGGCTQAVLTRSLNADYKVTALVRSSKKLTDMLVTNKVSEATISANLTIIEGDIHDVQAVKQALVNPATNKVANIIVSGIGAAPKLKLTSIRQPVRLSDTTLCEEGAKTVLAALSEIKPAESEKPLFVTISTTGLSETQRDVPIAFLPMYHWLLSAPHKDKKAMEQVVTDAMKSPSRAPIRGFVVMRPSLLMDGAGKGLEKVRVGWEYPTAAENTASSDKPAGPAVGYTITRDDVGAWMYENLINGNGRDGWMGKMVTLTT